MIDSKLEMAASSFDRSFLGGCDHENAFKAGAEWARSEDAGQSAITRLVPRMALDEQIADLKKQLLAAERCARFYKAMSCLYKKRSREFEEADTILFDVVMESDGALDRAAAYFTK